MDNIPIEIIEYIIEYIDYLKYHKQKFKDVLNDIKDISDIFSSDSNLPPNVISICWGNGIDSNSYNFNDDTKINGLLNFSFLNALKNISKKILFLSPLTINIGLKLIYSKIFFYFIIINI